MNPRMIAVAQWMADLSTRLSLWVERVCVALMAVLVLTVWLGICVRYLVSLPITFTEEASRYLVIWIALLAVSAGVSKRAHIGMQMIYERFPAAVQRWVLLLIDVLSFGFFAVLFVYGLTFVDRGWGQVTMVFGLPSAVVFMIVPIASFLAAVQIVLSAVRDQVFGQFSHDGELPS